MITANEIRVLDRNAEFYGVPSATLMENAGKNVADFIIKNFSQKNIIVFCGTGNNGGDGFVAARYLSKKFNTTVFLVGKPKDVKTDLSKKNFNKLKKTKANLYDITSLNKIDDLLKSNKIIIDAMLGIGLSGKLREPYLTIVKKINKLQQKVIVSVDVPTGLGVDYMIKPNYTVTFHDAKIPMSKQNSGKIKITDIGIPKKAEDYIGPGELITYYPKPEKQSHKGENGRLMIVGGGPYYGAPALSAFATLRTGADLVHIFTPKKVAKAITSYSPLLIKPDKLAKNLAKFSPNLIVHELKNEGILSLDDVKTVEKFVNKVDTLLIGPGLGNCRETDDAIEKILQVFVKHKKSIVIDADAIKVVGNKLDIIKNSKTVVTPHTGEFKELTNVKVTDKLDDRIKNVKNWSKKLGITILLKGPVDVISNGEIVKLNEVHNQAMTVGGTGDVLAGIVGCLLSKDVEPFDAARIAAFLNGAAGNLAFEKRAYGLISTDIIDEIPNVLKKYL